MLEQLKSERENLLSIKSTMLLEIEKRKQEIEKLTNAVTNISNSIDACSMAINCCDASSSASTVVSEISTAPQPIIAAAPTPQPPQELASQASPVTYRTDNALSSWMIDNALRDMGLIHGTIAIGNIPPIIKNLDAPTMDALVAALSVKSGKDAVEVRQFIELVSNGNIF